MKHRVIIDLETQEHSIDEDGYDGSNPSIRDQLIVADATRGFLDALTVARIGHVVSSVYTAHNYISMKWDLWGAPVPSRDEIEAREADRFPGEL